MYKLTLIYLCLIIISSCKSKQGAGNTSKNMEMSVREVATSTMGKPIEIIDSPDGSFALCIKKSIDANERQEFLVLDQKTKEVVYPLRSLFGKVEWEADDILKVLKYPGKIKDKSSSPEDFTEYINIRQSKTQEF